MAVPTHPRWMLRTPDAACLRAFLDAQRTAEGVAPFSYGNVGASRHNAERPHGYELDHHRVRIGEGVEDFLAGCAALRTWKMFPPTWTRIVPAEAPIQVGEIVVLQVRALGFWWLNAARIVYVIDESAPVRRFGFAYGTLPAHVEEGEERFTVELHPDGSVWYDLRAFSRPRFWAVRIAKPVARRLQARFVRASQRALQQAVAARRAAGRSHSTLASRT